MKQLILLFTLTAVLSCHSQTTETQDKQAILTVMKAQEVAWSKNDLEGFMKGYWKSDSLKFYGKNGLTFGWDKTFKNYKKGYPTKQHTGKLKFKINSISKISKNAYYVMGEYFLTRKTGNANGIFMLIFKKIKGCFLLAFMLCLFFYRR